MNHKHGYHSAARLDLRHLLTVLTLSACVLITNNTTSAEEDPGAGVPAPMVEMEARFVRVTPEQMREALGRSSKKGEVSVLTPEQAEKALTALKESKAEFFSNPRTITRSGRRAVVESVREFRYPTDYEPSKTELGKFLPTAFETRNLGVTVEFEPAVGPDGLLALQMVPQVVTFRGFLAFADKMPGTDEMYAYGTADKLIKAPLKEGEVWQPVIATQLTRARASIHSGQTVLIELMSSSVDLALKDPNKLSTLVFITARTLTKE